MALECLTSKKGRIKDNEAVSKYVGGLTSSGEEEKAKHDAEAVELLFAEVPPMAVAEVAVEEMEDDTEEDDEERREELPFETFCSCCFPVSVLNHGLPSLHNEAVLLLPIGSF